MIVPIEWLKEYVNIRKPEKDIGESFTSLGLLLEKPPENSILELEHRMDRSDWLSIVGCARDLAALEGVGLKKPEGLIPESKGDGNVTIKVKAPDLVKRFNTRVFRNITVKESPKWLRRRLEEYGLPSLNNIVDITNYVMVELGQPMHAQDLSKFSKQEIVLRRAKKGEVVKTLSGEDVEVDKETLVLAEGNNLIGIGAIVGSSLTAVDENTTDIVLDAGNYNQSNIRKTSRRIGIRNETVLRTEKFLHPELTQTAIERATKLILDLAGGDYYDNEDYYKDEVPQTEMTLRYSRIEKIGGIKLDQDAIKEILKALEYETLEENSAGLKLKVPYFRTDVLVEDDIVADILRINNYNNIPLEQLDTAPPKDLTPEIYTFEDKCRDILVGLGLHEHITNPLIKATGENTQIVLLNALNSDQSALRETIKETLMPIIEVYKKHKLPAAKLFEVGLTYHKTGNKYKDLKEVRTLEVLMDNSGRVETTNKLLKRTLSAFLLNMGVVKIKYEKSGSRAVIYQGNLELGELQLDSFTILTENLLKATKKELRVKTVLEHQTSSNIAIQVGNDWSISDLEAKILAFNPLIMELIWTPKPVNKETGMTEIIITVRFIGEALTREKREQIITGLKEKVLKNYIPD